MVFFIVIVEGSVGFSFVMCVCMDHIGGFFEAYILKEKARVERCFPYQCFPCLRFDTQYSQPNGCALVIKVYVGCRNDTIEDYKLCELFGNQ